MAQTASGGSSSAKLVVGIVLALVVGLAAGWSLSAFVTPPGSEAKPLLIQGLFTELSQIKTMEDARRAGYRTVTSPNMPPECAPDMGLRFSKNPILGGKNVPELPILLFNTKTELIGVEFMSLTPQQVPPWEHRPKGYPGMEFELWSLHIYIKDPKGACNP
jgi:hypothetical protein